MLYESISYGNNKNILPSSVVVVVISLVEVGTSDVSVVGEGSVWNERIFIGQKTDLRSIFEKSNPQSKCHSYFNQVTFSNL